MYAVRHVGWVVLCIVFLLGSRNLAGAVPVGGEADEWDDRFGFPSVEYGAVRAITGDSENLYVGGNFTSAGILPANNVARWDGRRWHPLGTGVNGDVYALAIFDGKLYAGGDFTQAGSVAVNGFAVWDGLSWSAVGYGAGAMQGAYKGVVRALAVADDALYIGGDFTSFNDLSTLDIVLWDGRNLTSLGDGLGDVDYNGTMDASGYGSVYALAVGPDGTLYAGGDFTSAGNQQPLLVNSVARWDGRRWEALGSGVEKSYGKGEVRALAVDEKGTLYAGGQFTEAGGEIASSIARWDGKGWQPVGRGVGIDSAYSYVSSLAVVDDALYAGGGMASIGGKKVAGLAVWQRQRWTGVGDGLRDSYDGVLALHPDGAGGLYAGGAFTGADELLSPNLVHWNGDEWQALGQGLGYGSTSGRVEALVVDADGLVYAGGSFDSAAGKPVQNIAVWDGLQWDALDEGVNGSVFALAAYGSKIYVGGSFTKAGGAGASYIAQYDSVMARWSSLESGVNGHVRALAVAGDGTLYVAGDFTAAGASTASYVAQWDGKHWATLGKGIEPNGSVRALAWDGRNLFLGGSFSTVEEGDEQVTVNGLLMWDSQTDGRYSLSRGDNVGVTRLGAFDEFSGEVYALAVTEQALYVGGVFDSAGGVATRGVATFDFDEGWQALGDSVSSIYTPYVYSLAVSPDGLLAGGEFTAAGRAQTSSLARWDGTRKQWEGLGGGLSPGASVRALAVFGESVYVGGQFVSAGTSPASAFARWGPPVHVQLTQSQILGRYARPTATPRPTLGPTATPTPTPTPCAIRPVTGGGVAGQVAPCGLPSRR